MAQAKNVAPQDDFLKRVKSFLADYQKLHEKHQVATRFIILYPHKKNVPWLAKLAGKVIQFYNGTIDTRFIDMKGNK